MAKFKEKQQSTSGNLHLTTGKCDSRVPADFHMVESVKMLLMSIFCLKGTIRLLRTGAG